MSAHFLFFAASGVNEVLSGGERIGTANNQVILGSLILVLIAILIYRERQQTKRAERDAEHHDAIIAKMDDERKSMNDERKARITMLMELIRENTTAFINLKAFLEHAVRIERRND